MKLILDNEITSEISCNRRMVIKTDRNSYTIDELFTDLIKPALLVFGYTEESVNNLVGEEL